MPVRRSTSLLVLCLSAFAVGRHFVTLPVLGLLVQLHQPPAQEINRNDLASQFRDVSCARGEGDHPPPFTPLDEVTAAQEWYRRMTPSPCDSSRLPLLLLAFPPSFAAFPVLGWHVQLHQPPAERFCCETVAGRGNARAVHDLAPLLEHDDFTVRPKAFVGHRKNGLQRSDGTRCYIRTECSGAFLFRRPSGRHPNHPSSLRSGDNCEKRMLRWGRCGDFLFRARLLFHASSRSPDVSISERLAVAQSHVSEKLRSIWPSLRRTCCSTQHSRSRAHRSGILKSFAPSGRRCIGHAVRLKTLGAELIDQE